MFAPSQQASLEAYKRVDWDAPGYFTPYFSGYLEKIVKSENNQMREYGVMLFGLKQLAQEYLNNIQDKMAGLRSLYAFMDAATDAEIKSKTKPGEVKCKAGCFNCCYQYVAIAPVEAKYIATNVELTDKQKEIIETQSKIKDNASEWSKKTRMEKRCVFLGEAGECTIYSVRPAVCRALVVTGNPDLCGDKASGAQSFFIAGASQMIASVIIGFGRNPKSIPASISAALQEKAKGMQ